MKIQIIDNLNRKRLQTYTHFWLFTYNFIFIYQWKLHYSCQTKYIMNFHRAIDIFLKTVLLSHHKLKLSIFFYNFVHPLLFLIPSNWCPTKWLYCCCILLLNTLNYYVEIQIYFLVYKSTTGNRAFYTFRWRLSYKGGGPIV